MKRIAGAFLMMVLPALSHAQEVWDLRRVVEYAMSNNITAKQLDVQAKQALLSYNQSKLSKYPNANLSGSLGLSSGVSQDPTTFARNTEAYLSSGWSLQSGVDIFNFYTKKNTILANEWEVKAAQAGAEKYRNDIALMAASAYLQILLSKEQEKVAEVQLDRSRVQLNDVRKRVNAGSLPEFNATQVEAQLAMDSMNLIVAEGNTRKALLALKAYLSMDAATPMQVAVPPVENIPLDAIGDLQPDFVYAQALKNLPQQRYNDYKLKAADYQVLAARGAMYPSIGGFAGLGSNYSSVYRKLTGISTVVGPDINIGTVNVGGTVYNVFSPGISSKPLYSKPGYFGQLADNFRQNIGISVSIPIFQHGMLRTNWERSKLQIENLKLQQQADDMKLKQDIYTAYNDAIVALEKLNASAKSVATNERAMELAQKRYNIGMLGTYDLLTTQNNLMRSRLEHLISKYDYVFKMKVLEFYKGNGIKL